MPLSGSVPSPVLHAQVGARLRELIVEGAIAPGEKLNERALAEQLAVSRTPLREAIRMLAAEGLVQLAPHRGAVAAQLSREDVVNTFEVIAGLEAQSGELAAERITPGELREIKALHFEMLGAHARRDLPAYYRLNARIHNHINAAARNPVLTQTYLTVNARLQALRFRSNFDESKWDRAVDEHQSMVERLERGDGSGMRRLMAAHIENKRDAVLELMQGREPTSARAARPAPTSPRTRSAGVAPPEVGGQQASALRPGPAPGRSRKDSRERT